MGTRVGIITDSVACIPADVAADLGIRVVPVHVIVDGVDHLDGQIDDRDLHRRLAAGAEATTASPAPGEFASVYQDMSNDGFDAAVVVTVSARLSAVHNAALVAARSSAMPVSVIDSGTVASAEGLIVRRLAEEASRATSLDEVTDAAAAAKQRVGLRAVVPDLGAVSRTGRVPKVVARVGDRLDLKPLIEIGDTGEARLAALARSMRRGIEKLVDHVSAASGPGSPRMVVMHTTAERAAGEIAERLAHRNPKASVETSPFTAVMSLHTGPGLLGVAWERDPAAGRRAETPDTDETHR